MSYDTIVLTSLFDEVKETKQGLQCLKHQPFYNLMIAAARKFKYEVKRNVFYRKI